MSTPAWRNAEVTGENHSPLQPMSTTRLDDWLAIAPDGVVTVFSGKVELGTGIRTALAQVIADELDVPLVSVRIVMGDTDRSPNEGYTAGSKSIQTFWGAARVAAAEARQALLALAAERLDAAPADLLTTDGAVARRDDPQRRVSYGDLLGGGGFGERVVTGQAPLKSTSDYAAIGAAAPRLDLAEKFFGAASFVHDVRLPGMLHARVVRPPSPGATLRALDDAPLAAIPSARAIHIGDFVAVVAEREEQAVRAAGLLRCEWDETPTLPAYDDLYTNIRQQPTTDQVAQERGATATALAGAARVISARYYQPFQAHASMGPSCAVARFEEDGALTVWATSQGVFALRGALADLLELPKERCA